MPKTWQPHQASRFAKELKLNTPYYVVMNVSRKAAPYEDAQLYSKYVFTGRLPLTGTPCTADGYSAATLCQTFGPVYDTPPRGMRDIADRAPQVAGPVPQGYEAYLDEAEIRGLEKQVRDGSNPRKRRPLGSWRV